MFPISDSVKAIKFPIVNILIIVGTVLVFIQQLLAPNPDGIIESYALTPSHVNFHMAYTLLPFVTAIFLHGGFLHIISNLWFLWIFGDNIEGFLGHFLYPIFYLFTGVVGNLVQYALMPGSNIPILGASGAIAGVLGAYYVFFPRSSVKTIVPIFLFVTIVNIPASIMLGYWFFLQIALGVFSIASPALGGIAFFAHVGGFMSGMIVGKILKR